MTKLGDKMRINAPKGQKVICTELRTGLWGGGEADEKLEAEKVYTVEKTKVFKDCSFAIFAEIPGKQYNTVLFDEVGEIFEATQSSGELYQAGLLERNRGDMRITRPYSEPEDK